MSFTRIMPAAPSFRALIALFTISECVVNCLPANALLWSFSCGSWRRRQNHSPLHVEAFVVVVVIFRRRDSVAREDHRRLKVAVVKK